MRFPFSNCQLFAERRPLGRSLERHLQSLDGDKTFTTGEWLDTLTEEDLLAACRAYELFCTEEANDTSAWESSWRGELTLLALTAYSAEMQPYTPDEAAGEASLSSNEIEHLVKRLAMLATLLFMCRKRAISLSTIQLTITPQLRRWVGDTDVVVDPEKMLEHFTELNQLPEYPAFMRAFSKLMFGRNPCELNTQTLH